MTLTRLALATFAMALAAIGVSGVSLSTANRAITSAEQVTKDAAVVPVPAASWENPATPWIVAAHHCDPAAGHLLADWRAVALDEHTDAFWQGRLMAETQNCAGGGDDKPRVQYTDYTR